MIITLNAIDGTTPTSIETSGAAGVLITDAFVGPLFHTEDGESLGVCMRDSGFDLCYTDANESVLDISLQRGVVQLAGNNVYTAPAEIERAVETVLLNRVVFIGDQIPNLADDRPKCVFLGSPAEIIEAIMEKLS